MPPAVLQVAAVGLEQGPAYFLGKLCIGGCNRGAGSASALFYHPAEGIFVSLMFGERHKQLIDLGLVFTEKRTAQGDNPSRIMVCNTLAGRADSGCLHRVACVWCSLMPAFFV